MEIDTDQPPALFKMQLFSLTGVPPERQKIMVKGGTLKDDSDWTKVCKDSTLEWRGIDSSELHFFLNSRSDARPNTSLFPSV